MATKAKQSPSKKAKAKKAPVKASKPKATPSPTPEVKPALKAPKPTPVKKAPVKAPTKPKAPTPTPEVKPALKPTTAPTSARSLTPGQKLVKTFRSGGTHTAVVQPDGRTIWYDGVDYSSVSSVASAMILRATGHEGSANGWSFFGLEVRPSNVDPVEAFTRAAEALYARAERLVRNPSEGSIDAVIALSKKLNKLLA